MTKRKACIPNSVAAWIMLTAMAALALAAAPPALAFDGDQPSCSVATLRGLYIFDASGYITTAAGHAPKAVLEFLNMNGDGTLTTVATVSVNGILIADNLHGTGSYTVNPDCTGALVFPLAGLHFDIYLSPRGTEFHMIQTDPANVLAGVVKQAWPR